MRQTQRSPEGPHHLHRIPRLSEAPWAQAIQAFLEAESFEDAIRNAVSLGGDSDTQAAIAGSIAGPYFGIPKALREKALTYLPEDLKEIITGFESLFGANKEPEN